MLLAFLAVSALSLATSAPFRSPTEDLILTDKEVEQYGSIIDLIPGIGGLIEKLKPLIMEKIQILLDPNMDFNQKVQAIMKVCLGSSHQWVKSGKTRLQFWIYKPPLKR